MPLSLSFGNLIILIGAAQGLFLSFLLFTIKQGNRLSHRLLALFLLFFSLSMIGFVIWDSQLILMLPHLSMLISPLEVVIGPIFFLYTLSLTQKDFSIRRKELLHFISFLAVVIYFVPFYLQSADYKIQFNKESYDHLPPLWFRFSVFSTIYNVSYILLTMLVIQRHRRTIKRYYSNTNRINLQWIQILFLLAVTGFLCCVLLSFVGFRFGNEFSNIVFSICIYIMGYYGMKQRAIFAEFRETVETQSSEPLVIKPAELQVKKYEKSGLSEERAGALLTALEALMQKEKLYLQPELNLQQLADRLNLSIHHLSQLLNQYKQQNFFDYINQLRVEEFKRQVLNPSKEHLSILGIAFECGFNSKAAFNAAFKKYTGLTPSAYRNQPRLEST